MVTPKVLIIDGYNFLHRARSGFQLGDFSVVFNFFRNLKSLVEMHSPTRVLFVTEGYPKARHDRFDGYKKNRKAPDIAFTIQKGLILELLSKRFPVSVIRHPDHEADDTIYNLIKRSSSATTFVVASTDSDFTQLYNEFANVELYNPVSKETLTNDLTFDYVSWKALKGDDSDNIPGLDGVGDKTAQKLLSDPELMRAKLNEGDNANVFEMNYELIKFVTWTDEEAMAMTSSSPTRDWDAVAKSFDAWEFRSILKEKTWQKYIAVFDKLWAT
jgi:5'-3' exonuclease